MPIGHCTYVHILQKMGNRNKKQKKRQRKKEEEEEKCPDLPQAIICDILLRVPPELLYSKFRLVCRCWHDIISSSPGFAEQLFNNSNKSSSLILQFDNDARHRRTHILTLKEGKLDITKNADTLCRGMGQIRASCNGLLLTHNPRNRKQLLVCNPVTKLMCALPECLSGCPHDYYDECSCSLAFDSSTNQYKVVHIRDVESGFEILNLGTTTATAGSDDADKYSWRKVPWPSETLSGIPSEYIDFQDAILVDSKVLHWETGSMAYVMSMDVSEERPHETRLPCIHEIYNTHGLGTIDCDMVEMGGCLSIMYHIHDEADNDDDDDDRTMDIWILEDFEQGSWIKKHSIGMKCVNFMRCRPQIDLLVPMGCLENGEVIVFFHQANTGLYVYDVRRNSMNKYFLKMRNCSSVLHKSSFTSWKQELVEVVD